MGRLGEGRAGEVKCETMAVGASAGAHAFDPLTVVCCGLVAGIRVRQTQTGRCLASAAPHPVLTASGTTLSNGGITIATPSVTNRFNQRNQEPVSTEVGGTWCTRDRLHVRTLHGRNVRVWRQVTCIRCLNLDPTCQVADSLLANSNLLPQYSLHLPSLGHHDMPHGLTQVRQPNDAKTERVSWSVAATNLTKKLG